MITQEKVWDILKQVLDPELNFNVVDLGLIYGVELKDGKDILVKMTMTTPFCPYAPALLADAKDQLSKIKEVGQIDIEVVWEPPWSLEKIKPEIREQLGLI